MPLSDFIAKDERHLSLLLLSFTTPYFVLAEMSQWMANSGRGAESQSSELASIIVNNLPRAKAEEIQIKDLSAMDTIIVVMGPSGTGKSTFIEIATGVKGKVGHTLESCTTEISAVKLSFPGIFDSAICFVDTPAFDNTEKSDVEILEEIADLLNDMSKRQIHLSGLLYFHRISDNRLAGNPSRMFKSQCGEYLKRVVLVTTMWDEVEVGIGEKREAQLRSEPWKFMIDRGASVRRFYPTQNSAFDMVTHVINKVKQRREEEGFKWVDEEEKRRNEQEEKEKRRREQEEEEEEKRRGEQEEEKQNHEQADKGEEEEKQRREQEEENRNRELADEEEKTRREEEEEEKQSHEQADKRKWEQEEEEKRRREESGRRKRKEDQQRRIQEAVENDGWTPWEGDSIESDEVGAENQGTDDRLEADFEVKEEKETRQLELEEIVEPEVPPNDFKSESQQKIIQVIDDPAEEALTEPIQEDTKVRVSDEMAEQEPELEKSAWGTWIAPQKEIFVPKRKIWCCCVVM